MQTPPSDESGDRSGRSATDPCSESVHGLGIKRSNLSTQASSASLASPGAPSVLFSASTSAKSVKPHVAPALASDNHRSRRREKVRLGPGHTPMDWARYCASLSRHPSRNITVAELSQHNTQDDCWVAINGVVYDITTYMSFHPGGRAILLGLAGKNATAYFLKYHSYVNVDAILEKHIIGPLSHS